MPDWPGFGFNRNLLSAFDTPDAKMLLANASGSGLAWSAANRAIFAPIFVTSPVTVKRIIVQNGTPSGNLDVGIYRENLSLLVSSGTTANTGSANVPQAVDITDTLLSVGRYYLALVLNNTTATIWRQGADIQQLRVLGCFQMDTAFPLPATAVPAAITVGYLPLVAGEVLRFT